MPKVKIFQQIFLTNIKRSAKGENLPSTFCERLRFGGCGKSDQNFDEY